MGATGGAAKAIDGKAACHWNFNDPSSNTVTHTNPDKNAWWNADLGSVKTVQGVTTYNRQDCC